MLEANLRDVKVKGKILRNSGFSTGTLRKKDGEVVPISIVSYKLDTYLGRHGMNKNIELLINGEKINSRIDRLQRDVLFHNVMNIDLLEV